MASWKKVPDHEELAIEYVPLVHCQNFFAVDASGSACWNDHAVLKKEQRFVEAVPRHPGDAISLWGSSCDDPSENFASVNWKATRGGTEPSKILRSGEALQRIEGADVWYLLTDGEVYESDVNQLAELAHEHNILAVPVVFVITGSKGSTPETTNISVGISFFAGSQDTLILFHEVETGKVYVIAAKGCFAPLGSGSGNNLASWKETVSFRDEKEFIKHCGKLELKVPNAQSRKKLPKGVSLGAEWERAHDGPTYVDLDKLLQAGLLSDEDLFDLLAEEAFNVLSVAYKTRRRLAELRPFIQGQKVQQITPKLEDVSGASAIIAHMGERGLSEEDKEHLQEQLREAHTKNREHYQATITEMSNSQEAQRLRKRNQLVDAALRQLADVEAAGYTADILSRRSNRARRAAVVSSDTSIALANLNFDVPSYKGFCLVCCGEEEVMSISLKEMDSSDAADNNTTDFALNFPLAAGCFPANVSVVSSQNICFQCALLGPSGLSIYKEKIKAIIPALSYESSNKKYINSQLYLALTAGLDTGASGLSQLFMAILEQTIKTKPWAGAGLDEQSLTQDERHEAIQRRDTFKWMVSNMLEHTQCRETFSDVGEWTTLPKALEWAARDFEINSLSSFVVTYPITGFMQLLSLGKKAGTFSNNHIRTMKIAKVIYSITSAYLAKLLRREDNFEHLFLRLIYCSFNFPTVPRDLGGSTSLINSPSDFWPLLTICLSDSSELLQDWTEADKALLLPKIQLTIYWLIHKTPFHCTAQTFFTRMQEREHLAPAVFDPLNKLPETILPPILLSLFASSDPETAINADAAANHTGTPPFKTPFGPSVLRCGFPNGGKSFIPEGVEDASEILKPENVESIRQARRRHLIEVFGVKGRFEGSQTGLPEVTDGSVGPSSRHTNLHVCIPRCWGEMGVEERRAVLGDEGEAGVGPREEFIRKVVRRITKGRRGNIYQSDLEGRVRSVLPSFLEVLGKAVEMEGRGRKVEEFEVDFEGEGGLEAKIRWELRAEGRL